jgi:hypothetical protein
VGHVELREGTIDKAITRNLDRDDIVSTVMASVTSLTAGCARCHDHKFDPISQEDYYSLQAVFAGIDRADRDFDDDPEVHRKRVALAKDRDRLLRTNERFKEQLKALKSPDLDALNESLKPLEARLKELVRKDSPSNGYHSAIETRPDVTKWVQVDLGASMPLEKIRLVPARPVDFPDTPGFGFPTRFKVEASEEGEFTSPTVIADFTAADHAFRTDHAVEIDGNRISGRYVRATATRLWERAEDYIFALAELEIYSGGANAAKGKTVTALDSIDGGRWNTAHLVDGFDSHQRLSAPDAPTPEQSTIASLEKALAALKTERDAITLGLLPDNDRAGYEENQRALAAANAAWEALPEPRKVYAGTDRYRREGNFAPAESIRPIHLLIRGSEKTPGPEVGPGTVGCIEGLESRFTTDGDESDRRAALARWLTDERNALTWRSIVNRVWHYHFGQGIVSTPNDFGRMGAPPTHPELLDWLAAEFLKNGQSLKWLHRQIVTSATYRQASVSNPAFESLDGSNQFLWRMNRRQLEAEALRDATLAVSGKLDLTMGGPGVNFFVFEDDHSPRYKYAEFDPADPSGFRRSIYRFVVRSVPDPFMTNMDCADPSQSVPVRNQTLTAIQALSMLNNPVTVRQAAYFSERVARDGATVSAQIEAAYRIALNRAPNEAELAALVPYAEKNGMAAACRLILNSNEFMFVD